MSSTTDPRAMTDAPKARGRRRSDTDEATPAADLHSADQPAVHETIATRAHQIFLERGGEHGHDVDDWLQAEREVQTPEREATRLTRGLNEKPGN